MVVESKLYVDLFINVIYVGKNIGFMMKKLDYVKIVDIAHYQK